MLLMTETLFSLTEAKAIIALVQAELPVKMDESLQKDIHERIVCLLIAHRGPVLAQFLMEQARGIPLPVDGPGPVVPDSVMKGT